MKINVSLDDDVVNRIDENADKLYMSRSGFISLACCTYMNSLEIQHAITEISVCMRRIADNNEIDEQTKQELEHFSALAELLTTRK